MIGKALILLVRAYQCTLSRLLPPNVCIYEPTCSQYMIDAIRARGVVVGVALGVWRICRCHPFAKGGYDPVVPPRSAPAQEPRVSSETETEEPQP